MHDLYILTNGRSTFPFCIKSVEEQKKINIKYRIIENENLFDAYDIICRDCKKDFFICLDDDIYLHPYSLYYMINLLKLYNMRNIWKITFSLYENYSCRNVLAGCKIYNTKLFKQLEHYPDKRGKIDPVLGLSASEKKFKSKIVKSILGLHVCSTVKEAIHYLNIRCCGITNDPQKKYSEKEVEELSKRDWELAGKSHPFSEYLKYFNNFNQSYDDYYKEKVDFINNTIGKYPLSPEEQFNQRVEMIKRENKKLNSNFHYFLKNIGK